MAHLGVNARRLLAELRQGDWMPPHNDDRVRAVLNDISALDQEVRDVSGGRSTAELPVQVAIGVVSLKMALLHNKRSLLAYMRHRARKAAALRWDVGPIVPPRLAPNLSPAEHDFFNQYDRLLTDYQQEFGLDLTAAARPPRELFIEVRSLADGLEVFTDSGAVRLDRGVRYLLRHTDADPYIRQGLLEQVQGDAAGA